MHNCSVSEKGQEQILDDDSDADEEDDWTYVFFCAYSVHSAIVGLFIYPAAPNLCIALAPPPKKSVTHTILAAIILRYA